MCVIGSISNPPTVKCNAVIFNKPPYVICIWSMYFTGNINVPQSMKPKIIVIISNNNNVKLNFINDSIVYFSISIPYPFILTAP